MFFFLSRQAHDNVRLSNLVLDHLCKTSLPTVFFRLDAKKAFDCVILSFLTCALNLDSNNQFYVQKPESEN